MKERLAILLSRKLSGEVTADELNELEEWIKNHPEDHYLIDAVEAYWKNNTAPLNIAREFDTDHFEHILATARRADSKDNLYGKKNIRDRKPIVLKLKRYAVAAVIIGLVFLAGVFFFNKKQGKGIPFNNEIVCATTSGAKSQLLLPDGSKVWLNGATRLHYSKEFNGKLREVYLNGEAYFEVRKDSKHPFIVHTSYIDIRVLGTAFNVKSYNEDATIETTLIHGSIKVTSNSKKAIPDIILHPNEKLIFSKQGGLQGLTEMDGNRHEIISANSVFQISKILPSKDDSVATETAWMHNQLLFDGDTFKELAVKMERWFDVKINFESNEVAAYRLRGAFEDETIDEALKALQQISNFHYAIKDKTVTIYK